jgi:hypothetical protein
MTETLTETRLVFLPKPDDIYPVWPTLAPLFQGAIDKAVHGEFTVEHLLNLSLSGSGLVAYIEDDKQILMALVMELKYYPGMSVLNVVVMAGQNMKALFSLHSPEIEDFAKSCGVKYFEASTSRAMAKMLQECGWSHVYETVRFKLQEAPC